MRRLLHLALFCVLLAFAPACDKSDLKLDKKTERKLKKAAESTKKVAAAAGKELKKAAKEAVKEAQKPAPERSNNIPDHAQNNGKGDGNVACRAVESAGNPFAVADENRWRNNARCR